MPTYAQQIAAWAKRRQTIIEWRRSGLTLAEIAKRLGISRQRVHQISSGA